jgi:hypothetical protein
VPTCCALAVAIRERRIALECIMNDKFETFKFLILDERFAYGRRGILYMMLLL